MLKRGASARLEAYAAFRSDAAELVDDLRGYRVRRWDGGSQPLNRIELSVIHRFQRRLTAIHSRWETIAER